MRKLATMLVLTLVLAPGLTAGEKESLPVLPPVDQAAQDPSFLAFRQQFQEAIAAKDTAFLLGALDAGFFYSFPPYEDQAAFRRYMTEGRDASRYWKMIGRVLELGGGFLRPGLFSAPYVPFAWPRDLDATRYLAVIDSSVTAHAQPNEGSAVLDTLGWQLVERAPDWDLHGQLWARVVLPGGGLGFVHRRHLWSALSFRVGFEKVHEQWKWKFFLFDEEL